MRRDDAEEFDAFCVSSYPRVVAALTHIVGDVALAEDLAQEALIRAYQRWDRISRLRSPLGWTVHVGANLARSALRRRLVQRRARQREPADAAVHHDGDATLRIVLNEVLRTLSPVQREVVVLRYFVGLDTIEVGELLGIEPNAVRQRTHRALAAIRANLPAEDAAEECNRGT